MTDNVEVDNKNVDIINNVKVDNKNVEVVDNKYNEAKCICENGTSYDIISTSGNIRQNVEDFLEKYKNCDCTFLNY